jgi:hypothetical protein
VTAVASNKRKDARFMARGHFTGTAVPAWLEAPSGTPGSYPAPSGRILKIIKLPMPIFSAKKSWSFLDALGTVLEEG